MPEHKNQWNNIAETAVVTFVILQLMLSPVWLMLAVYTAVFTNYGLLTVAYVLWIIYDRKTCNKGGRRMESIRNFRLWKYFAKYFPIQLRKTVDLDPSKNYLFCMHPHGVFAVSAFGNFAFEATGFEKVFPGLKPCLLTVAFNFLVPIQREWMLLLGLASSSKEGIGYFLKKNEGGNAPVLCVGGVHEMLDAHPKKYILHLSRKKGFIRLALEHGSPIVPVFAFGENDVFAQFGNPEGSKIRTFQNFFLKLSGIPLVCPKHIIPRRHSLTTVVGAPIEFDRNPNPSDDEVNALHAKYVTELKKLFYLHRDSCQESDRELIIV